MDDRALIEALAGLGLDRRNHRAVALLPLVEVAWADRRVQRAEQALIREIADRYGLEPDDPWLQRWLVKRPSRKTFLAARTVLLALMSRAGRSDAPHADDPRPIPRSPDTLDHLLELCVHVAEAAGGLFGLAFTYEQSERECIQQIADSLALGPAVPDVIVRAWDTAAAARSAPAPRSAASGIGDQVTEVRRMPRKARVDGPTAPPAGLEVDATTLRLTRPKAPAPAAPVLPSGGSDDDADYSEDDPTVPFFDDHKVHGATYVLDGDDEEG